MMSKKEMKRKPKGQKGNQKKRFAEMAENDSTFSDPQKEAMPGKTVSRPVMTRENLRRPISPR